MSVTTQIAQITHVYPAPQAESQRLSSRLGQVELGLKRERFETSSYLDHQTSWPGIQYEGSVRITSTFAQVFDMRMVALNFQSPPFSIDKQQRGCGWLAGFVIQDAALQSLHAHEPVAHEKKKHEQGGNHQSID
jgi:hypothetical protein